MEIWIGGDRGRGGKKGEGRKGGVERGGDNFYWREGRNGRKN